MSSSLYLHPGHLRVSEIYKFIILFHLCHYVSFYRKCAQTKKYTEKVSKSSTAFKCKVDVFGFDIQFEIYSTEEKNQFGAQDKVGTRNPCLRFTYKK